MILPQDFKNTPEYFQELVVFLQRYSWLYEAPVTNFLTFDIFSKIPEDWIEHLLELSVDELNNLPTGLIKDDWPSSLIQFSQDCKRFTLPILNCNVPLYNTYHLDNWLQLVPRAIWRGMSQKKTDEVEIMSKFVHNECKLLGINKIVDLGSGLGYVDRLLLLRGYKILGIESQAKLVAFSTMQKENFFSPNIAKNLDYVNMRICESLIVEVKNVILESLFKTSVAVKCSSRGKNNENVNNYDWERLIPLYKDVSGNEHSKKVCMIGLHACGDLAVTGIKMYLGLPEVSALVLVPCCYHKMSLRNNCFNQVQTEFTAEVVLCQKDNEICEQSFNYFPLSETLKRECIGAKFICKPFLRLANQGTNISWQGWTEADHLQHSFNVLSRAVIELVAHQEGATFKKCFRRVVKKTSLKGKDFSSYVDESLNRCEFVNQTQSVTFQESKEKLRSSLLEKWELHKSKMQLAEVITALQMCLEPVAESLLVADRTCFFRENGVDNVRVVKMIDSKLSPRCLAYIASKT